MSVKNKISSLIIAVMFIIGGVAIAPSYAKPAQSKHKNHTKKVAKNHHKQTNQWRGQSGPMTMMTRGIQSGLKGHKDLKLTKKQKASLKKIFQENRKSLRKDSQKVRQARMNLFKATIAQNPSSERIENTARSLGKALGAQATSMAPVFQKVRKTLNDKQLKQIKAFYSKKTHKRFSAQKKHTKKRSSYRSHNKSNKSLKNNRRWSKAPQKTSRANRSHANNKNAHSSRHAAGKRMGHNKATHKRNYSKFSSKNRWKQTRVHHYSKKRATHKGFSRHWKSHYKHNSFKFGKKAQRSKHKYSSARNKNNPSHNKMQRQQKRWGHGWGHGWEHANQKKRGNTKMQCCGSSCKLKSESTKTNRWSKAPLQKQSRAHKRNER